MKLEDFSEWITCDECGAEFLVKSVEIKECSVVAKGTELMLSYFVCPECNQIYDVLLVEPTRYAELMDDLIKTQMRIRRQNGKGNEQLLAKLGRMADAKRLRLHAYVSGVRAKFPGSFTFSAENKKDIIYRP